MRLAGTCRQYSKKAIPQLARMTIHSGEARYLRCPYQAQVMKMLEPIRRRMVRTLVASPVLLTRPASNASPGELASAAARIIVRRDAHISETGGARCPMAIHPTTA